MLNESLELLIAVTKAVDEGQLVEWVHLDLTKASHLSQPEYIISGLLQDLFL